MICCPVCLEPPAPGRSWSLEERPCGRLELLTARPGGPVRTTYFLSGPCGEAGFRLEVDGSVHVMRPGDAEFSRVLGAEAERAVAEVVRFATVSSVMSA